MWLCSLPGLAVAPAMGGLRRVVLEVKNLPAIARDIRDIGSFSGSGRFPGGGHGNSLQYS